MNRTRIETKKTIDGRPEYLYRNTQFTMSKTQVIDLLMGTKLYGDPEVPLRELVQNSVDACLLRDALERSWGNQYSPEIQINYYTENGEDVLEVSDNGVGMDQYIIDSYYSKIGSSFYMSSDFYELKAQTNSKFTPTSRFGIGILSCFMVADTLVVDTRKVYEAHRSSDPINITIEGQDSIFWIRPGARSTPGTTTKLFLRKNQHPWQRMTEDQFVASAESIVPNPPFKISVRTKSYRKVRDEKSFKKIKPKSLKDYSWSKHENIREFQIDLSHSRKGFVGSAIVGVLEHRGQPVSKIAMTLKLVMVDDEEYELEKSLMLSTGSIQMTTSSITIDDNDAIEQSTSTTHLAESRSKLSLHGIEVPTTLFPNSWSMQRNQVKLEWPLPLLLVIDICGERDLDLNSSRSQIIMSDKWLSFEEALSNEILRGLSKKVSASYWTQLKRVMLDQTKNEALKASVTSLGPPVRRTR